MGLFPFKIVVNVKNQKLLSLKDSKKIPEYEAGIFLLIAINLTNSYF